MRAPTITAAVDRGLEILLKMEELKAELKGIEAIIEHAALHGDQIDLVDPDREGKQYLAQGTTEIVPVVLTADLIIGTFQEGTAQHAAIESAAEGKLPLLYRRIVAFKNIFESGKKFRIEAGKVLGENAPQFVSACIARDKQGVPKSDIKIEWKRSAEKEGA